MSALRSSARALASATQAPCTCNADGGARGYCAYDPAIGAWACGDTFIAG